MFFFDRQLDEFRRSGDMNKLVTVKFIAFDAEQNITITRRD